MRLLELDGEGILQITETEPGKNLMLKLDRSKIDTIGKKVVGKCLIIFFNILLFVTKNYKSFLYYKRKLLVETSNFEVDWRRRRCTQTFRPLQRTWRVVEELERYRLGTQTAAEDAGQTELFHRR